MTKELALHEVLLRASRFHSTELDALYKHLGEERPEDMDHDAEVRHLCSLLLAAGSNSIASVLRGGKPVDYPEVVYDVGKSLGAKVQKTASAATNEALLLEKLFADMLDKMTHEERLTLLRTLDPSGTVVDPATLAKGGAVLAMVLLKHFGGFAIYKFSVVLANYLARVLLGRGLTLAANAGVTRLVGLAVGPIGWGVTAAWLAVDLAGPAFRKTVPAVVHVAYLRQLVTSSINVGIVGDGSVGKDALLQAVFNLESQVDPVAGSTSQVEVHPLGTSGTVRALNYPGFNDYREGMDTRTDEYLANTDVFLLVVDLKRGVSKIDVDLVKKVQSQGRPWKLCANKADLLRPGEKEKLLGALSDRTGVPLEDLLLCAFDPDPRLGEKQGVESVRDWLVQQVKVLGKDSTALEQQFSAG